MFETIGNAVVRTSTPGEAREVAQCATLEDAGKLAATLEGLHSVLTLLRGNAAGVTLSEDVKTRMSEAIANIETLGDAA